MDATPDELKTLQRIREALRGGDSVIISRGMAGGPPAKWPDAKTFDPQRTHPHRFVDEIERIPGVTDEQSAAGAKDHRAIRWRWYVGGVGPVSVALEMDNATTVSFIRKAIKNGSITIPNWKRGDAPWRTPRDSDSDRDPPAHALSRPKRKKIEVRTFGDFCDYVATRPRAENISATIDESQMGHERPEDNDP